MKITSINTIFITGLIFLSASCSMTKNIAMNSVSDMLAGADKDGNSIEVDGDANAMLALTGESDVQLVADFFPTALKLYEIMYLQNPDHAGLAVMSGSLYVMYANVFVQEQAECLPPEEFDRQLEEFARAKLFYLRGRDYIFQMFDRKYPGFTDAVMSGNEERYQYAVSCLTEQDVNAAYWAGAGWLGAFSLDPLDMDIIPYIGGAVAMLERAAELNPDYNDGSIWDVLSAFYIAAPADFGGNPDRAELCHKEALRVSGGKTPGPYVTYAQSFCIPRQDADGYIAALEQALAINPDDNPGTRLATIITQQKAQRLLDSMEDYIIIW